MPSPEAQRVAGPFSGLLVVDLTHVLAGPFGTTILIDLGARVIKIEPPGHGDDNAHVWALLQGTVAVLQLCQPQCASASGVSTMRRRIWAGPCRPIRDSAGFMPSMRRRWPWRAASRSQSLSPDVSWSWSRTSALALLRTFFLGSCCPSSGVSSSPVQKSSVRPSPRSRRPRGKPSSCPGSTGP